MFLTGRCSSTIRRKVPSYKSKRAAGDILFESASALSHSCEFSRDCLNASLFRCFQNRTSFDRRRTAKLTGGEGREGEAVIGVDGWIDAKSHGGEFRRVASLWPPSCVETVMFCTKSNESRMSSMSVVHVVDVDVEIPRNDDLTLKDGDRFEERSEFVEKFARQPDHFRVDKSPRLCSKSTYNLTFLDHGAHAISPICLPVE